MAGVFYRRAAARRRPDTDQRNHWSDVEYGDPRAPRWPPGARRRDLLRLIEQLAPPLVGFAVTWAVTVLLRRMAPRIGLVDWPNERSLHDAPRPRGGGAAVALGAAAALAVGPAGELGTAGAVVAGGFAVLALTGLWDDLRTLAAWPRLLVQLAAAVAVAAATGGLPRVPLPPPLDVPLGPLAGVAAVLWLLGVTNFFNFMDGIDGLATGQAVLTLSAVLWLGWSPAAAGLAVCALGPALGFLPHNWPRATIFLGDAGSAPLGFLLACLPLLAPPPMRAAATVAAATSLGLFLLDPLLALLVRWRRGRRIGEAHRDHAYQRLSLASGSHGAVTGSLLAAAALLTVLGAAGYERPGLAWLGLGGAALAFAFEESWAARRGRATAGATPGA
jgi:UDP-N-acetylmuramyl pentapeptide phosphotransferase/UDP-N-acetylglucosamine-1-phosphate transferase